jgi:hypothetical protein
MRTIARNQIFLTVILVGAACAGALVARGLSGSTRSAADGLLLVAFLVTLTGGVIVGIGFAQRGESLLAGMLTGAFIGLSISLLVVGAFGFAASNATGNLNYLLISIACFALGIAALWLFNAFKPYPPTAMRSLAVRLPRFDGLLRPQPPPEKTTAHPQRTIFISYRRDDSPDVTGRIYDRLVQHYGRDAIFKDVDSIPYGVDFRKHLHEMVGKCDVVLAVIGDGWLNASAAPGQRRLDDQADFVRIELEAALLRDIRIVPLLVKDAAMPKEEELPPTLRDLAYRNGIPIRHDPDFHVDMDRLIKSLDQSPVQ